MATSEPNVNITINIDKNGTTTLATSGCICDRDIDINVDIPTTGGGEELPEEALHITGNCNYRFMYGGWDWFLDNYGDKITTTNITSANQMFAYSDANSIGFDMNMSISAAIPYNDIGKLFMSCKNIKTLPKINNAKPDGLADFFSDCNSIREVPEDFDATWDWSRVDTTTSSYAGSRANTFKGCYSLRSFPMSFLNHGNPTAAYSYSVYYNCFNSCYVLDEIIGIPFPHKNTNYTSNMFVSTFTQCNRVKNITFALQEDGTPYTCNWSAQTIDLTGAVGFGTASHFTDYNSGITKDKRVDDDATYQALKNDPDWYTPIAEYSRYNHDSAVATINSLPDTSAFIASNGGKNIIKFTGTAGSKTDGGAINTLTSEEIQIANDKGWIVYVDGKEFSGMIGSGGIVGNEPT